MTVGIVGAGVMGTDTALDFAAAGHLVLLCDVDAAALANARELIPGKLRRYRMMAPRLKAVRPEQVMERLRFVQDLESFADAQWIVENVTERWEIKREVYEALAERCGPDTCFAVNTSCISITRIGALLPDPGRAIGMHFMNPVPLKQAVEVVRAHHTSDETVQRARVMLKTLGKRAIVVDDFPGFVSNRLSHLFMNEAAFLVQDGVAGPADIDALFREGYGHKMGPLETADLIGLDTVVNSLDVLYDSYQDPKFRCCPLLRRMKDAGEIGRKSGKGFYTY